MGLSAGYENVGKQILAMDTYLQSMEILPYSLDRETFQDSK